LGTLDGRWDVVGEKQISATADSDQFLKARLLIFNNVQILLLLFEV
jgi:hypothetical protein